MIIDTPAVVMRTIPFSDNSLIVRCFTETQGKVTVMGKGVRRSKNPLSGMLEAPNILRLHYHFKESREIQILRDAEFHEDIMGLRRDYLRISLSHVMVDLLDRSIHPLDPQPILFRLIQQTLIALSKPEKPFRELFWFYLLHLGTQLGFKPGLDTCQRCNAILRSAHLDLESGTLHCPDCQPQARFRLEDESLRSLKEMTRIHLRDITPLHSSVETNRQITEYLIQHLGVHVEGIQNAPSLRVLKQLEPSDPDGDLQKSVNP